MAMITLPSVLGLGLTLTAAAAERGWQWRETTSPHFAVSHEMPWMPPGFIITLEKMHGRLRMDLGMFSPWMAKERIKLFLYKDQKSYLAGEFEPPQWSNGIAIYDMKAVAVPDNPADRKTLQRVISHETTHLLFEGYWKEAGKHPPTWLNKGLAMMEEADVPDRPERLAWFQAMVYATPESLLPLPQFFEINPTKDLSNKDTIGNWYVQAYSLVYFLYRGNSRLQFKNFCSRLRDGKELEDGLWFAYRYRDIKALEKAWRAWLARAEHKKRVDAARAMEAASASGSSAEAEKPRRHNFAPTTITPMKGFKSLRE